MKLSGKELRELRTAVLEAVVSEAELERLVSDGLEIRLKDKVEPGNLEDVVFRFLQWLEAENRTGEFITVLIRARPRLTELLTALLNIATAKPRGLEHLRWLRWWFVRHRWKFVGVAPIVVAGVASVLIGEVKSISDYVFNL